MTIMMYKRCLPQFLCAIKTSLDRRFYKSSFQYMMTTQRNSIGTNFSTSAREIQIPLDYGYIAAKEWGSDSGIPVLALHGWQDNAGTFDTLIPLLSSNLHVIAIDFFGHGCSTHKPLNMPYFKMEFIYQVKCIAEYLGWNKFNLMGHSMGSEISIVFASMYQNMVEKVVGIDLLKPVTYPQEKISEEIKRFLDLYMNNQKKIKNKSGPPAYTEEEALKRIIEGGVHSDLTEDSAKILMIRGTKKLENEKLTFSRDIRTKYILDNGFNSFVVMKAIVSEINCDLLLIKAKKSPFYSDDKSLQEFLDIYRKKCKSFEYVTVEGNHFVHLNNPERIASTINAFLLKKDSLL